MPEPPSIRTSLTSLRIDLADAKTRINQAYEVLSYSVGYSDLLTPLAQAIEHIMDAEYHAKNVEQQYNITSPRP